MRDAKYEGTSINELAYQMCHVSLAPPRIDRQQCMSISSIFDIMLLSHQTLAQFQVDMFEKFVDRYLES